MARFDDITLDDQNEVIARKNKRNTDYITASNTFLKDVEASIKELN